MLGKVLTIAGVALSLAACAEETPSTASQGDNSPAGIEAAARAACQAYGITPRTERYERCVRNEYASRSTS